MAKSEGRSIEDLTSHKVIKEEVHGSEAEEVKTAGAVEDTGEAEAAAADKKAAKAKTAREARTAKKTAEAAKVQQAADAKEGAEAAGYYAIQTTKATAAGKDAWSFLKKADGKIAKASKKASAVEVMKRILDKRREIAKARVVWCEDVKGEEGIVKRAELEETKETREAERVNEIPKELIELYGKDRAEQLNAMDAEERGAVLHLLQQVAQKQEELNSFGVLAAQRSGFRKSEAKVKSLNKLKNKIAKTRDAMEAAREEYETAQETGRVFAEKQMKEYPYLFKWLQEQLGIAEKVAVTTKTRRRGGEGAAGGKKALILKMFKEGEGIGKRLKPSAIAKIMSAKGLEGVWKQYAVANPLKALKLDGFLAEDDEQRYYIP